MAAQDPAIATIDELTKLGDAYKQGTGGAREGLLGAASKLFSQLMLPAEAMLHQQWAQTTHQAVLRLSLDIHLFEALAADNGAPQTSKAIAEKTEPKAEPNLVSRMLRHLAAMGTVLETDVDTFAPTPLARSMTDERFRDTVYFMADATQHAHQMAPAYFEKTGYTAPKSSVDGLWQYAYDCKGLHYFEYFAKVPLRGKQFANMMDLWSEDRPKWFQENYYPVQSRLIEGAKADGEFFLVDIGAGSGHDLQQLYDAFGAQIPGKLVLQDRPEIVKLAKVVPEIVGRGHDFLTEQPVKGKSVIPHCLAVFKYVDLLDRSQRILPPLHHSRLGRRNQHADPQVHHPSHGERLLQDPHQRLRRPGQGSALGADVSGLGVDGHARG